MAVDPNVSRAYMKAEVEAAMAEASTFGWVFGPDYEALTLRVKMTAYNGDAFSLLMTFHDYREVPAAIDFEDPKTGTIGSAAAFPRGRDNFFNTTGPVICAPINLKAYKVSGQPKGLHSDWAVGDWANSKAEGFDWHPFANTKGALWLIQTRLDRPEQYLGRMSP